MSGTPTFQITNAGLQAAAIATPTGPFIDIVAFQVGSGFGYTPLPTDLSINGSLLFSGTPSSYQNVANATIDILCEIPPNAGPFQFGEIALMLPGNVMFAKAVFPLAQNKFSALGSNVVSSYELHCLLTLAQGTAIFQVSTLNGPPSILQIFDWSAIYPPGISSYPAVPLLQIMEPSEYGDVTLLSNASSSKWTVEGATYQRYDNQFGGPNFSVANASSTWIEIPTSTLNPLDLTSVNNRRFVIETSDGYFRSVSTVVTSGSNYRFTLNGRPLQTVPAVGSNVVIYRDDQAQGVSYYSQILDPLYYDRTMLSQNTGTTNAYAATYKQKNPVPYEGMIRSLDIGIAVNTGASTFACDGGAPFPIVGQADAPLQGGEINGAVTLRFTGANNQWIIIGSAYGTLQIPPAVHGLQAVNLAQTQALITADIAAELIYYDQVSTAQNTGTTNAYAATYSPRNPVPYEGMYRVVYVQDSVINTGPSTFACDGGAPYPVMGMVPAPLQGGEMRGNCCLRFNYGNWVLVESEGPLQVPNALHSQQAVNLGQIGGLIPPPTTGGSGTYSVGGSITVSGLLHGPADGSAHPGMGRTLTNADNINDTSLPSGCYDTAVGALGLPANWPTSWDGILQIVNYGTITQTYYPEGMGGGDAQGNNGLPVYYRSFDNARGAWSNWFQFMMQGKLGADSGYHYTFLGGFQGTFTDTNTTSRVAYYIADSGNWIGGAGDSRTNSFELNAYVNGAQVGEQADNDRDDHRVGFITVPVGPGQTITITSNPFSAPAPGTMFVNKFST